MRIRFKKIDGFVRVNDETKYLVLFGAEKYDSIYNRIRYLVGVKSGITYVFFFHNYARIKVDSYNSLPQEKTLTFHNVTIPIKSDENNYYYNLFLERCSYKHYKYKYTIL